MTIRARLTLAYGAAIVATVLIVSSVVWWQVGSALGESLDKTLATRAADVLVAHENQGQMGLQDDDASDPAGTFVAIYDDRGNLLDATTRTPKAFLALPSRPRSGDVEAAGTRYRIKVLTDDRGIVVVAGSNLGTVDAALAELARWLMLVGGAAAAVSMASGWWLAGRALRPVAILTSEATRIGTTDLDARLPVPPVHDELGVLTDTLNSMIDRLAESVRRERRFIAAASHELRTPITALQAELELAEDEDASPAELRADIRDAHADATRIAELTTSLLTLAAADTDGRSLVRAPVEVDVMIEAALRRVQARARQRGVRIVLDAPSDLIGVDRVRLETAIANLVANAVAYGPAGSQIDVSAHVEQVEGAPDVVLVVEVLDRGPGIPEEFADRIFEPFQRGPDASVPGAGLGLATADAAVRAHDGTIGTSPRPGGGTRFWLRVPA